jgi:plasmid maintenance system antidote protein VapI
MNDLAHMAGLVRQTLHLVTAGNRPLTAATAEKLASALESWAGESALQAGAIRRALGRLG